MIENAYLHIFSHILINFSLEINYFIQKKRIYIYIYIYIYI